MGELGFKSSMEVSKELSRSLARKKNVFDVIIVKLL